MKKLYTTLFVLCLASGLSAQCFMQISCNWVTCVGNCDGTAMAYPVGMTAPITYQWMPGNMTTQTVTGLCAGTYTCMAVDSLGCTATAQCTVGSPQPLQAIITNFVPPTCPTCCDGSASGSASGGTPAYAYTWTGPSMPPFPGPNLNGMCVGTYTLCVTDMNGCTSCATIVSQSPNGVIAADRQMSMSVSPNPTEGNSTVSCSFAKAQSGEILVINLLGEVVQRKTFASTELLQSSIDLSNQPSGVYFVSVVTGEGTITQRISRE